MPLSQYQASLLALAYGNGVNGVSRAEASWLLWESDDAPAARHRISQLLYGLKRKADFACIEEGSGGVLLGTLPSDANDLVARSEFRDLGALEAAASHEFLGELDPPTAAFAHWIDAKRAALRNLIRDRVAGELAAAERASDWIKTRSAAEILLKIDPSDEETLRTMLKACALSGSRVEVRAAVRWYAENHLVRIGERWSPERATTELIALIDAPERRRPTWHRSDAPAFTGRASESKRLFEILSSSPSAVQFAVVAGEAGIGKTRLIQETLARLRLGGQTVLEAGGSLLRRDLPLNSLIGALSDERALAKMRSLEEPWRSSLRMLLPDVPPNDRSAPPALDPQATSRRLMESIYQLLAMITAEGPTVLFLDDLQWLDKTTLCVLEFLCERTPAIGLSVVFGLRDEVEQEPHVRAFLEGAKRRSEWVQLNELDPVAADRLLDAAPRRLERIEREKLVAVSGGNPFFLIELVNDYCLNLDAKPKDVGERVPSSVKQLIASRLEGLSREARTLIQLLSVVGELEVGDLDGESDPAIEGLSIAHLADVADDLLRARLIDHDAGTIRIRHDLIRQAAYDVMGPVKRSLLHKTAAQMALRKLGEAGSGEAAMHFDKAGESAAAYQHAIRAAAAAQEGGAVPEAIRFWEVARRNAGEDSERIASTVGLAELLYEARRVGDAVPALEAAEAALVGEGARRLRVLRFDALSELPGADQEGCLHEVTEVMNEALSLREWPTYADAMEVRFRILDRSNQENVIRTDLSLLSEVLKTEKDLPPYADCVLNSLLSLSVLYLSDRKGIDNARVAVEMAEVHHINRLLLKTYHRMLFCLTTFTDLDSDEAQQTIQDALLCAKKGGDLRSKASIHTILAVHYLNVKDFVNASRHLGYAEALSTGPSERVMLNCNWGSLYYRQGDYLIAQHYYNSARLEAETQPVLGAISFFIMAGLGLCALATGSLSLAQEYEGPVRKALETWSRQPFQLVMFLAELERRRGRPDAALTIVRQKIGLDETKRVEWIDKKMLEVKYLKLVDGKEAETLLEAVREKAKEWGLLTLVQG